MIMKDPYMLSEINKKIDEGKCAEEALEEVCDSFIDMLSSANDEFTVQRAVDVRDIKTEILSLLTGAEQVDVSNLKEGTVLVAHELTPSMTAGIDRKKVVGIITELGSGTSHAAILARAMEIPAVLGAPDATKEIKSDDIVVADGNSGDVIINPDADKKELYTRKKLSTLSGAKRFCAMYSIFFRVYSSLH